MGWQVTSPTALRTRQRRTGYAVILLATGSLFYGIYDSENGHHRDKCMASSFAQFSDALTVRWQIASDTQALQTRVDELQNHVIQEVAAAGETSEVVAAFNAFNDGLDQLEHDKHQLVKLRNRTPVPDFPRGKCDQ